MKNVDLIAAREFALMKPTPCLVNVGLGLVINEQALYDALRYRRIAGARPRRLVSLSLGPWSDATSGPAPVSRVGQYHYDAA